MTCNQRVIAGSAALSVVVGCIVYLYAGVDRGPSVDQERADFAAAWGAWRRATELQFVRDRREEPIRFPGDHGVHVDVPAEQWQVLMNLASGARRYLLRVMITRLGAAPQPPDRASRWAANQYFVSTVSLADAGANRQHTHQRYARAALGLAHYDAAPLRVAIDGNGLDWSDRGGGSEVWKVTVHEPGLKAEIRLSPLKTAQTVNGVMLGAGRSRGYAMPRNAAEGRLAIDGQPLPVSGTAWMVHGWGDLPPVSGQITFLSATLLLDDGSELTLLQTRRRASGEVRLLYALRVTPEGGAEILDTDTVILGASAFDGRESVPLQLHLHGRPIDLNLVPWIRWRTDASSRRGMDTAVDVQGGELRGWGVLLEADAG